LRAQVRRENEKLTPCEKDLNATGMSGNNNYTVIGVILLCFCIARIRPSYGNSVRLSVRLSVCHDPVPIKAQVR